MILALDVGNSQIYGGLYDGEKRLFHFRRSSRDGASSDEMGLFLRSVIRENGADPRHVERIAICTVVPAGLHSLRGACVKYFDREPFVLQAGVRTGLRIKYRNPVEVGADRIANAIGATELFPGKNLIVIDFGTATTFCAVTAEKDYLGGMIVPGLRLMMEALGTKTAKLPSVEIVAPPEIVGRSTVESIQSGLYFGTLGMIREVSREIRSKYFEPSTETLVVGTGGFSHLFEKEGIFDRHVPDLVLTGLIHALKKNL